MAFTINGPGNAFMQVSEIGLNKVTDAINDLFDIENPDGVQASLRDQLGILKAFDPIGDGAVSGTNGGSTTNNVPKSGTIYYQDDVESEIFKVDAGEGENAGKTVQLGPRPYSVFNKFSLVNYRGTPLNPEGSLAKSQYYNKIDQNTLSNPTVSKIIEVTAAVPENKGYRYDYSDFAMAKYFGKIPNNQMITLRRFAFAVPDDIVSPVGTDLAGTKAGNIGQPDIARAVTWMGEDAGNQLSEIIKFSTSYEWKDAEAQMQTLNSTKGARSGAFGAMLNSDAFLTAALNAAQGTDAYQDAVRSANAGYDSFSNTYPNHVFGPLNVINKVLMREQGLSFEQEFTLKFEYELRDLSGANPKILMLDQLSNILALTYSNAPFWGGSVRYIPDGSVARPLGKISKLRSGDFKGFLSSVVSDFTGQNTGDPIQDIVNGAKGFLKGGLEGGIGKTLENIIGGAGLEMFNSPQGGEAVNSLLTGDPTGQWHVTIGNPLNPIAVIGNLACTGTSINFEGAMGVQDFPERMVVTVTLKPGRPRDKAEIESMFNTGRGRFYLQPDDTADINNTTDVSAYGNKDRKASEYVNTFRKISNG